MLLHHSRFSRAPVPASKALGSPAAPLLAPTPPCWRHTQHRKQLLVARPSASSADAPTKDGDKKPAAQAPYTATSQTSGRISASMEEEEDYGECVAVQASRLCTRVIGV